MIYRSPEPPSIKNYFWDPIFFFKFFYEPWTVMKKKMSFGKRNPFLSSSSELNWRKKNGFFFQRAPGQISGKDISISLDLSTNCEQLDRLRVWLNSRFKTSVFSSRRPWTAMKNNSFPFSYETGTAVKKEKEFWKQEIHCFSSSSERTWRIFFLGGGGETDL